MEGPEDGGGRRMVIKSTTGLDGKFEVDSGFVNVGNPVREGPVRLIIESGIIFRGELDIFRLDVDGCGC